MSEPSLAGKTSIVTGAGGGIGQAICLTFARAGAKVACLDIDLAAAEKTAAVCGTEALALRCDVSSEAETRAAAATSVSRFGAVHVLVNAAATDNRNGTILDISADEWSRVFAVNVTGAFLMSRAVLPTMIAAGGGSIIHIVVVSLPRRVPLTARQKVPSFSSPRPWRWTMPVRISGSMRSPPARSRPAAIALRRHGNGPARGRAEAPPEPSW